MRFHTHIVENQLLSEVDLNLSNIEGITFVPPSTWRYLDQALVAKNVGGGDWIVKFGKYDEKTRKIDIELTGEFDIGKTRSILSYVIKCIHLFIQKYQPHKITFTTDTESRRKMYSRLITLAFMKKEFMDYDMVDPIHGLDGKVFFSIIRRG